MPADSPVKNKAEEDIVDPAQPASARPTATILGAAIAVCLLLQLHLLFVQPVNWDEFRFLADIHSYQRGELSSALLTFQVHLFGWLTGIGTEIEQIRIARLTMLTLEIGTLSLIWVIGRRFFDKSASLLAVLGYISFSFVLQHGASFRFDPIVTFLVMASLALLLRERMGWIAMVGVGLNLALATMVSVKTALALPLILAAGLYRLSPVDGRRETFLRLLLGAATALLSLALLYGWHVSTLAGATNGVAQDHLASSYSKTVGNSSFLPGIAWLRRALVENPLHWIILIFGIAGAAANFRADKARGLMLLAFLLPLLTISFYRNAFPYFYAFIMAPASILFAAALGRREVRKYVLHIALVWVGSAIVHHQQALSEDAEQQQQTVQLVHRLFPQPVPYIDRCSMIGSFPQSGVFLSTWWLENYRDVGKPIMRDLLRQTQPLFIIANSPRLREALEGDTSVRSRLSLFQEDRELLRSNYIHYSGPIWIAGKRVLASGSSVDTEFMIAGEYVVESGGAVSFDGRSYESGEKLEVARGVHRVGSAGTPQYVTFRWASVPAIDQPAASSELTFGRF